MNILSVNCGSSSLKLDLAAHDELELAPRWVARATVDGIGSDAASLAITQPAPGESRVAAPTHSSAFELVMDRFDELGMPEDIDGVGHRVVHGGPSLTAPTLIDAEVLRAIEAVSNLAPLHNAPALDVIAAARRRFRDVPMVATFDTAYFADLPEVTKYYAIPRELSEALHIRRYGFHGLAHRYMARRVRELRPETEGERLVTLQLGSGCSAAAIVAGRPIDTSMGFTPLEGLVMGTRSGSIDPSVGIFLEAHGYTATEVDVVLNHSSGLLALSERSADVRELEAAATGGDARSRHAIEAFAYSIKRYIGAYAAAMGGLDGIVFGGGIGEHSALVRRLVCAGMSWCGLELDERANSAAVHGEDERISSAAGSVAVWVVPVSEAAEVVVDARAVLLGRS